MKKDDLLLKIQELGFAKVETELYLDTHPENAAALAYYRETLNALREATEEYENTVGPLTACGTVASDGWTWINGPWPWFTGNEGKE